MTKPPLFRPIPCTPAWFPKARRSLKEETSQTRVTGTCSVSLHLECADAGPPPVRVSAPGPSLTEASLLLTCPRPRQQRVRRVWGGQGSEDPRRLAVLQDSAGEHRLPLCRVVALAGSLGWSRIFAGEPASGSLRFHFERRVLGQEALPSQLWALDVNEPLTGAVTCLGHSVSPGPGGLGGGPRAERRGPGAWTRVP